VRVFFLLAGIPDQMFTWLVHYTMMPVKKVRISWKMGDFMYKFHILSENILFEKIWLCLLVIW